MIPIKHRPELIVPGGVFVGKVADFVLRIGKYGYIMTLEYHGKGVDI